MPNINTVCESLGT